MPVGRDVFVIVAALVIVAAAQLTKPGSPAELAGLLPAVAAFLLVGGGARLPMEAFAALVIVPVTVVVGHEGDLEGAQFLTVIMTLYTSWHLGSTLRALVITAFGAASSIVIAEVLVPEENLTWMPWVVANLFTLSMGLTLRNQRRLIEELHDARRALAEQAVAEERRRMARELHDVAGHTLAAMMLHVTGARHVLDRDPREAERALREAEDAGRASLDQIRATVAALRTDERGTDQALAGSDDLIELIDSYRRAGLRVEAHIAPEATAVAGPVGTAVHRIVQEALANVARHAPANKALVDVGIADGDIIIAVSDHGRPAPPPDTLGLHFGLVGMRERARALGGELTAGPHEEGWSVRVRMPSTAVRST